LKFETKKTSTTIYINLEDGDGARCGEFDDFVQQQRHQHGGEQLKSLLQILAFY